MKCYFLRHGIAVEPGEWHGSDFDRPLTREGRERMEREAKAINALSLGIECIVTSPLLRAKETAAIVAGRLDLSDCIVEDARLGGGFNERRLVEIFEAHAGSQSILLVGHEPAMSSTIGRLIGGASIELKKAALAGVEISDRGAPAGTLLSLIPPKLLAKFGSYC